MHRLERQDAQRPNGILSERREFLHALIQPRNIGVAVDRNAAPEEFRDGRRMIPVTVRYETSVNAACPKAAADLDAFERNPRVKEETGMPIPDEIGIPAAPRRNDLDVHG